MSVIEVSGVDDPRLEEYRIVSDPDLLQSRGVFIAEGRHVVRRLLTRSRFRARSLLLTRAAHAALADVLAPVADIPIFLVAPEAMQALTGFNIHRGCLAAGERTPPPAWEDATRTASRVVVLERVSNADNVGGIFRSAAAFGADAVVLGPGCADPLYRKAIRTSMGAALQMPFAPMRDWPADLERLRASGFTLVALTPAADAGALRGAAFAGVRVALLVGHEGDGLSAEAMRAADVHARIPIETGVDSLNAATAAAVALYEIARAR